MLVHLHLIERPVDFMTAQSREVIKVIFHVGVKGEYKQRHEARINSGNPSGDSWTFLKESERDESSVCDRRATRTEQGAKSNAHRDRFSTPGPC